MQLSPQDRVTHAANVARAVARQHHGRGVARSVEAAREAATTGFRVIDAITDRGTSPAQVDIAARVAGDVVAERDGLGHPLDPVEIARTALVFADAVLEAAR